MTTVEKLVAFAGGCTVVEVDGQKWATDGSVLVIVDHNEPEGLRGDAAYPIAAHAPFKDIIRSKYSAIPDDARTIIWSDHVYVSWTTGMAYRTGERNGHIASNEAYLRLCGFGGDVQMMTTGPDKPIYAVAGNGSLIGVLMPMRFRELDLAMLSRVDDFQRYCIEQWLYAKNTGEEVGA